MDPKEVLENGMREADVAIDLQLAPGLSSSELDEFETLLGVALPPSARTLLMFSGGFTYRPFGKVTFVGKDLVFEFAEAFPKQIPLAADGAGNFWAIDVRADTGRWGPVFFVSHDPPVLVIQAQDLTEYITQVLNFGGNRRFVEDVSQRGVSAIWRDDPYLIDVGSARGSSDPTISRFANELPDSFRLADLRECRRGTGFAWGRGGSGSRIIRHGSDLLFGTESRAGASWMGRFLLRTRR